MNIIVDTREQNPVTFSSYEKVKIYRDTLSAADYTICGHEFPNDDNSVLFERKKDCNEFTRNIGAEWERFCIELDKMAQYKNKSILICTPDNFADLYQMEYTKLHPNFVYKRIAEIQVRYQIPVIFFDNRSKVEEYMFRAFYEILKKTEQEA